MQLSCFFDIIKPRRIEHLQKEEPFSSDPYFKIWIGNPYVNFSPMSPKLVRTQPHTVENRGITMAPLFLRLISWKSLTQSIKIFVKLDFFTNVLVVCFVFVYIATLLRASADYTRKEVSFWFWQWQRCEF